MKQIVNQYSKLALFLFLVLSASKSFSQSRADQILGTWWNQEKDGQMEIYKSLYGFTFSEVEQEWNSGKIYDGRKGKTYKCRIRINTDQKLEVTGYIGASWMGLGETNIWTKIK